MSEPTLISLDCWIEDGSFLPRSVRPPPLPDDVPLLLSLPPQAASSSANAATMASSAPCLRLVPTIALASPSLVVGPRRPDDGPNVPHVPRCVSLRSAR